MRKKFIIRLIYYRFEGMISGYVFLFGSSLILPFRRHLCLLFEFVFFVITLADPNLPIKVGSFSFLRMLFDSNFISILMFVVLH